MRGSAGARDASLVLPQLKMAGLNGEGVAWGMVRWHLQHVEAPPLHAPPFCGGAAGATRTHHGPRAGAHRGGGMGIREAGRMCRSLDTSEDRVTSPPPKNSLSWGLSSAEMCTVKRTKSSAPFRGFLITEALNRQTPVRGEGRDLGEAGNSWRKRKRLGGGCRPGLQAACGSC